MLSRTPLPADPNIRPELWLLGQPPLADYLEFVRRSVVDGAGADRRALADEWRRANDRFAELERSDKGAVDARVGRLPAALKPRAKAVLAHPTIRATFDTLPVAVGMVELDRLMVHQMHVTEPFVAALAERIGPDPEPDALFDLCLPTECAPPPVAVRRLSPTRFQFVSASTDMRPHDLLPLDPRALAGLSWGPVAAALAIPIGFSVNCLSVVRSGTRLMLQNGYHRAVALRRAGITHAPAIVQTVTRRDELNLVACRAVAEEPAFWFAAARPPLLKDFFDPAIAKVLPVRRMEKIIEVSVETRELDVPAL